MTKKSKTRNKVTTSAPSESNDKEECESGGSVASNHLSTSSSASSIVKNGKVPSLSSSSSTSGFITDPHPCSTSKSSISNNNTPTPRTPSLAGIPGIVDDFLAPKFVKVLNLSGPIYERIPPPAPSSIRKIDGNANKLPRGDKEADCEEDTASVNQKKNKRKKSKPIKNISSSNQNTSYDSEDGRELDVLVGGVGVNGNGNGSTFQSHLKSGLNSRDATNLAQLERIRSSAFRYEGNNIVLVDQEGAHYPTTSCYDDYNYDYDADDDLAASGGGPGSASVPSDETSTLGLDQEDEEDDEEEERVGSWSLSHHIDYGYPTSKQQASSSVASSESENNASSLSTTASSTTTTTTGRSYPALASCTSIWDGVNNPCEIKDCSKPATKKCSQCKTSFYCGEDHQRLDWKKHKNECIPYRMESRFGDDVSVAVASRNIPAGQTIFSDKPLVVLPLADPDNDFLNVMLLPCIKERLQKNEATSGTGEQMTSSCDADRPACFGCLRCVDFIGSLRYNCNRCKLPLCSYNCQMDPFHQAAECQAISALGGWTPDPNGCYHSMYMDVEIVRALQLGSVENSMWERFLQMKQNLRVESYKSSSKYQKFIAHYRKLVPFSAKMSGYNDDLIGCVHAIITALSFRPSLKSSYKLLFTTQILFGHDCIPNTFHYLEESPDGRANRCTLITKAAIPICKKELITIDFSPTPFLYYPLRRMLLRNVLSIDNCNCKRCRVPCSINDTSADIKCPRCRDGLIYPETPYKWSNSVWECSRCHEEFSYSMVASITDECRKELASILNQPRQYVVPALQQFISRREQDLNPSHSIILQAWSFIETQLRTSLAATRLSGPEPRYPENTLEEYRLLSRCCDAIESHLNIIRPGICYERGCLLFNRYHIALASSAKRFNLRLTKRKEYIQELMQCVKTLQEALKIFQMFEGYNRDVALHIQETTSALVTTKSFIQQQLLTENEESRSKRAIATANANALLSRDSV